VLAQFTTFFPCVQSSTSDLYSAFEIYESSRRSELGGEQLDHGECTAETRFSGFETRMKGALLPWGRCVAVNGMNVRMGVGRRVYLYTAHLANRRKKS
jgi:hypothetical protein